MRTIYQCDHIPYTQWCPRSETAAISRLPVRRTSNRSVCRIRMQPVCMVFLMKYIVCVFDSGCRRSPCSILSTLRCACVCLRAFCCLFEEGALLYTFFVCVRASEQMADKYVHSILKSSVFFTQPSLESVCVCWQIC